MASTEGFVVMIYLDRACSDVGLRLLSTVS